jgi:transposase
MVAHRKQKDKRVADRIKTILNLNEGYSFHEISKFLLLDDSTLRSYYAIYSREGIRGLLEFNYVGGLSYLSTKEIEQLDVHLQKKMYLTSKEIAHYIEQKYGVNYTLAGVRGLLEKLDFVYKKTKHLPGKGDLKAQKLFEKQYHKLKANKGKNDKIYFMDGVHPLHNSMLCNGWIKKGMEKAVKSNTGRDRLNINGACNVEDIEVIIHEDISVNAQSTIRLFDKMQVHQPKGNLFVIADNAKYYRSILVSAYIKKNSRIKLIFLPSYSPNLNLIERLWRFYKKKILYDKYYETFQEFKQKTKTFFENIQFYKEELISLLKDNFYYPIKSYSNT